MMPRCRINNIWNTSCRLVLAGVGGEWSRGMASARPVTRAMVEFCHVAGLWFDGWLSTDCGHWV